MALDEILHQFGDSPHSCLVWRSQLLIRFEFEPPRFRPLALLPPTRFYCGTMQNGTGWKSALGDSPHSCLVWRIQLLIRFEFEPPRFQPLALLPPTRFYCGTMQNGTGWNSALILGFPAQLPSLEKPVTYFLNLSPLGFGHLPCCPQLDFILNLSPLGFGPLLPPTALLPPTRFYCGTMQNGTGWNSALIWGFPAVALSVEASYLFVLNLSPLGLGHLP